MTDQAAPPSILEAAHSYAQNGVPVFPLTPQGKRPLTEHGLHDATTDREAIERWWADHPEANLGIPTGAASGFVVIDVDPEGLDLMRELTEDGKLPPTRTVQTPRGYHLYYFAPEEERIRNGVGERGGLGKGIDVRGDGGYVVVPPSVGDEGNAHYVNVGGVHIEPLPEWVVELRADRKGESGSMLERLRGKARVNKPAEPWPLPPSEEPVGTRKGLRKLAVEAALLAHETEGGRNHRLNEVAYIIGGWIAAGHLDEGYAVDVLYEAAVENGMVEDDGERDAIGTLESGLSAGADEPHHEPGLEADWVTPEQAYNVPKLLHTLDDLANLPPIEFLVDDILPARSLSVVFGPSGTYKSFLVLDWALSIASGRSWAGHEVEKGHVVYVAAEGASGILKRARAWLEANPGYDPSDRFRAVPRAVKLSDPDSVMELRAALHEELTESPSLIIVDTFARSFTGDENSSTDVGVVIDAIDAIRHEHGATVLLVHHSGRQEGHERGSTALEGAMDARYEMSASQDTLQASLKCRKMKDREEPRPVHLKLRELGPSLIIEPGLMDEEARKRLVAETIEQHLEAHPEGLGFGYLLRQLPLPPQDGQRAITEAELDPTCAVVTHRPDGYKDDLYTLVATDG